MEHSNSAKQSRDEDKKFDIYDQKVQGMQKYLPLINQIIQQLEDSENPNQENVMQMHLFQRVLQNSSERISFEELVKCELALSSLYDSHISTRNEGENNKENEETSLNDDTQLKKTNNKDNEIAKPNDDTEQNSKDLIKKTEPEIVFVPQTKDVSHIYENEDDPFQDLNSENLPRKGNRANNNIGNDDDVEVIEVRNSPICLDTDDDDDVCNTPKNAKTEVEPKSSMKRTTRGFARKSTAKTTYHTTQKRQNITIELIDSSDDSLSDSGASTLQNQIEFLKIVNLCPTNSPLPNCLNNDQPSDATSSTSTNNKDERTKALNRCHYRWLSNFITQFASYNQQPSSTAITFLQSVMDAATFAIIIKLRCSMDARSKTDNRTTNYELMAKLRELFIQNNELTPIGIEFCVVANTSMPTKSLILIVDKNTGQGTVRSRTARELYLERSCEMAKNTTDVISQPLNRESNREECQESDNYTPNITIEENECNGSKERRRSSRIMAKKYKYCESDSEKDDDDCEDDTNLAELVQRKAREARKKRTDQVKSFENVYPLQFVSTELTPARNNRVSTSTSRGDCITICDDTKEGKDANRKYKVVDVIDLSDESASNFLPTTALPKRFPKNISTKINLESTKDFCIICQSHQTHIVHHYVNIHRGCEIYHCRFTENQLGIIRQRNGRGSVVLINNNGIQLFQALCAFCEKRCTFKISYWYLHLANHTGEYAFRCTGCNIRKPTRTMLLQHIEQMCSINGRLVQDYFYNAKSVTKIEIYLCAICNYAQLHRTNILKHLNTHHNVVEAQPQHTRKITLLTFSNKNDRMRLEPTKKGPCTKKPSQNYIDCMSDDITFEERVGDWTEDSELKDNLSRLAAKVKQL